MTSRIRTDTPQVAPRARAWRTAAWLLFAAAALAGPTRSTHAQGATGTRAWLHQRIEEFAHDSLLGREAGAIGNVRAAAYLADWLQRIGVAPRGEQGFLQDVPLVIRSFDPAGTIQVGERRYANGVDFAPLRALSGITFGDRLVGSAVVAVYAGRLGTEELIDTAAVRDRVVIFAPKPGQPANASPYIDALPAMQRYAAARAFVFVGYDVLSEPTKRALRNPHMLLGDSRTTPPALVVTEMLASSWLGVTSLASALPGARSQPADVRAGWAVAPTPFPARNVIGVVRGTDARLRNEFIALGAHSDHVGLSSQPLDHDSVRVHNAIVRPLGANDPPRAASSDESARIAYLRDSLRRIRPPRMDSVFNGADDDASGAMVLLGLARHFAAQPPRRSLLFVWHTAEEKGLLGASWFTDHPTVPLDSIVAHVNLDQVSRGGPADVAGSKAGVLYTLGTRRLSTELGGIVDAVNARGFDWAFDASLDAPGHPLNGYCRSDHYMYARYGIPVAFFSAGWHRDYHMVSDETEYVQMDRVERVHDFVRELVGTLANRDTRLAVDGPKPDPRAPCRQ